MKRLRLDRILALTLLVLALLIVFVLPMLAPSGDAVRDSIESPEPEGRLALALLLRRAGFEPESWRSAAGRLPSGPHVVWAARAPQPFGAHFGRGKGDDGEEREDGHAVLARRLGPDALALHDLAHYRHFVEGGGTLVLAAGEDTQAFLREVGLDALVPFAARAEPSELAPDAAAPAAERIAFVGADERIEVEWPAAGVFVPPADAEPGTAVEPLAVLEGAGPVAWSAPVGGGRIVVLGDDGFARNGDVDRLGVGNASGLGRRQHGLFAVRLVERLSDGGAGRLLFDETALGRWRPETALELATSGARGLLVLHIVLLFVVLAWRATWVREFPRDPEPLERVSPLVRAHAQASLYARARRFDLLATALRRGVLDGIARRLGRGPLRARPTLEPQGAGELDRDLERIQAALDVEDRPRWEAAFLGPAPSDAAGLAALGAELAALERASAPAPRAGPPRAGHGVRARRAGSGIVPARAASADEREPRPRATAADRARPER